MPFESLLITPAAPIDAQATRSWLVAQDWAFEDPHGTGRLHLSGHANQARLRQASRAQDASRFPAGVVAEVHSDRLYLEARADAATLARARALVEHALGAGSATMRRDGLAEEPLDLDKAFGPLPPAESLDGDALARPVTKGRIVTFALGDEEAPGGHWELEVHSSGVLGVTHTVDGAVVHRRRGALPATARLDWLEAAAHLDEDDDETEQILPKPRLLCVTVELPDDEWSLFMDVDAPSPSATLLVALVRRWRGALDAWADGDLALDDGDDAAGPGRP